MEIIKSILYSLLYLFSLNANWEEHWIKGQEFCKLKQFQLAEIEYDLVFDDLGDKNIELYPGILVERGRLYYLIGKNEKSLFDLNRALKSDLKDCDYEKALVTKIMVCSLLHLDDEALKSLDKLKATQNYPKVEHTDKIVIIRNLPKCSCYKKIMGSYFIDSGICRSEKDIHFLADVMIIEKEPLFNTNEIKNFDLSDD